MTLYVSFEPSGARAVKLSTATTTITGPVSVVVVVPF